jgi:hypothetical protein
MASEAVRIGVVASDVLQVWQRDALVELRAAGAVIAARFAPQGDQRPITLTPPAARLARAGAAAFALVPWDPPALADPADSGALDAVLLFAHSDEVGAFAGARWGCWEVVLPGDPPAFEDVERGWSSAEVRIERRGVAEATVIARAGAPVDRTSFPRTLCAIVALAVALPADAVRRARAGVAGDEPAPPRRAGVVVDARRAARLARRCALRRVAGAIARRIVHARWRVGRLHTAPAALLRGELPAVAWLDLPRGRFWADPFPLVSGERVEVLLEGYDYARDRGYLARAALEGDRIAGPVRDLARPACHLSYPFVVEDGAERYVMPEESQRRRVALYALDGDGLREARVLIDNFAAVDPTLVRHAGRWWLFAGDAERDENAALLLFHAASLDGPWEPHPLNPIVRDVRCARPAGTPFALDGVLYRPAQDCSTGYGARVALARIDVLTTNAYRETVVAHVAPPAHGRGRHGLHTFALRDGVCLIDGKDLVVDPAATWALLRLDLRRLLREPSARARRIPSATEAPLRS